jgi:hypothetical protein
MRKITENEPDLGTDTRNNITSSLRSSIIMDRIMCCRLVVDGMEILQWDQNLERLINKTIFLSVQITFTQHTHNHKPFTLKDNRMNSKIQSMTEIIALIRHNRWL